MALQRIDNREREAAIHELADAVMDGLGHTPVQLAAKILTMPKETVASPKPFPVSRLRKLNGHLVLMRKAARPLVVVASCEDRRPRVVAHTRSQIDCSW